LYPVDAGKVLIGDYNLNSLKEESLNQLVGIVPQQIDLFAGSVLENIALGEFQPDTQRIMQLANEIGAVQFINELPNGLGTYLGENGLNLSGGQRQRLAILRALYPDPEIIVFDEATSALDNKSEELILRTMLKLRDQGKTVIAITHRIGAVKVADEVVLLDKGTLVTKGAHSTLQAENEKYRGFWKETLQPQLMT
jgi:ATP-binding cassette subfamily B protein